MLTLTQNPTLNCPYSPLPKPNPGPNYLPFLRQRIGARHEIEVSVAMLIAHLMARFRAKAKASLRVRGISEYGDLAHPGMHAA